MKKLLLSLWLLFFYTNERAYLVKGNNVDHVNDSSSFILIQELVTKLASSSSNHNKAELWTELGLLYQQQQGTDDNSEGQLHNAVDAFQRAIRLYDDDDAKNHQEDATKSQDSNKDHKAALYFQLGETYYLLWATTSDDTLATGYSQHMMNAWEHSKQLYRSVMSQEQEEEAQHQHNDPWISIGYAMVCIRQGVYYVEMSDALQAWELLHEGLMQHLEPALQQLSHSSTTSLEELHVLRQQRVTAWHNAATAATVLGQFDVALQSLQHVLEYYERETREEEEDLLNSYYYAQALYSQADVYLQLGQYEMAKQSYQKAMDYYQQQKGVASSTSWSDLLIQQQQLELDALGGEEWQENIQMYQDALQEYNEKLQESKDPTSSAAVYEMDHGYVGDLHATLGSLYLSTNELVMAEMHLRQAIRFYTTASVENDDDDNRRYLADVHFNLAQMLFQQGEYQESAEQRILACQLYQETVGEGINPMLSLDEDGSFAVDASGRMEEHGTLTKRTSSTTVNSRPAFSKDTNAIMMDADQMSQWKNNHTFANDEL